MKDHVILVDQNDEEIGTAEKLAAHRNGQLHRAFSVLIFNSKGEMLLQQRASSKYHSGKLWTNACCSHPKPGETTSRAAYRRLREEIGLTCDLQFDYKFLYRVDFENGLIENELDHVYKGISDQKPMLNEQEAMAYKYMSIEDIQEAIANKPASFTHWFKLIMNKKYSCEFALS